MRRISSYKLFEAKAKKSELYEYLGDDAFDLSGIILAKDDLREFKQFEKDAIQKFLSKIKSNRIQTGYHKRYYQKLDDGSFSRVHSQEKSDMKVVPVLDIFGIRGTSLLVWVDTDDYFWVSKSYESRWDSKQSTYKCDSIEGLIELFTKVIFAKSKLKDDTDDIKADILSRIKTANIEKLKRIQDILNESKIFEAKRVKKAKLWEPSSVDKFNEMDSNHNVDVRLLTDKEIKRIKKYLFQFDVNTQFKLDQYFQTSRRPFYRCKYSIFIEDKKSSTLINIDNDDYFWVLNHYYRTNYYKADTLEGLFQLFDDVMFKNIPRKSPEKFIKSEVIELVNNISDINLLQKVKDLLSK